MNLLLTSMEGHSNSNASFCNAARPPAAPTVALPTAGLPITPATTPLALVVPVAYANSPRQSRHRSAILSRDAISLLRTACEDLTPSLDHQDIILAVNRRFGNSLPPLQSAADGALLAQRTQENAVSAAAAFQTAQILAAKPNAFQNQICRRVLLLKIVLPHARPGSSFIDPSNSFHMLHEIDDVDNEGYIPAYLTQDRIEGRFQQRYKLMLKMVLKDLQ